MFTKTRIRKYKPFVWVDNWQPAIQAKLNTPCWECVSHPISTWGRPFISYRGKKIHIARYIYEECFGFLGDDLDVCHKCDNVLCINPEHLYSGTAKENLLDMSRKNRFNNGKNILPNKTILEMLFCLKMGFSTMKIAHEFGVSNSCVKDIRSGKRRSVVRELMTF